MLFTTLIFKELFVRLQDRKPNYICFPTEEKWEKVEKITGLLVVINSNINVISRSEYPNLNYTL